MMYSGQRSKQAPHDQGRPGLWHPQSHEILGLSDHILVQLTDIDVKLREQMPLLIYIPCFLVFREL